MSLVINNYNFIKETFESEFIITLNFLKETNINYKLKLPTNPILDSHIISLNEENINIVLLKLHNLIKEDEYGITSRIELIQFTKWLGKVYMLTNQSAGIQL